MHVPEQPTDSTETPVSRGNSNRRNRRPSKPGASRRRISSALFLALLIFLTLISTGRLGGADAAYAAPKTITGKADIVITNKQQAYYGGAVALCTATIHLPDGSTQTAYGRCISGSHYAVPYDGTYDYVGTLQSDGTYAIVIHSNTSAGANAGAFLEGEMWGTQQMGEIVLRYNPKVTVRFNKSSADMKITDGNPSYSLQGAVYDIYDAANDKKVATITTDENGHAECELAPQASYYAVETKAPSGFTLDKKRVNFKTSGNASSVELSDRAGTIRLHIKKRDSATRGEPQNGATLEGATFNVSSTSTASWSATGTTDENGVVSFDDVPLGTIVVTETEAPTGYKLDSKPHTYTVLPDQLTETGVFDLEPDDFTENVIAFDIDIVKYRDSGSEDSGLQTGAKGVRFEIISNTTGKVVGALTTDGNGKASTARAETVNREAVSPEKTHDASKPWMGTGKRNEHIMGALPYDAKGYTVHEVESTTPEGYRPCPDWTIDERDIADWTTLHYIVDNDRVRSRIQIVKTDAVSGQPVPLSGFTFQLLDSDRRPVAQEVWYPSHEILTEFKTDESGVVTFPKALEPGTYYIREVAAQPPYILPEEDMRIVISENDAPEPVTVVRVPDMQARGVVRIEKTCTSEELPQVAPEEAGDRTGGESGRMKCGGLAGAEFDIVAVEDIVGPDGTVQAAAGCIVDHVVTDAHGIGVSSELPLGAGSARYSCIETKAPEGHALDETPHEFTLDYESDTAKIVYTDLMIENEPTELLVDKEVLGSDAPLEGATFAIWNVDDAISVQPRDAGSLAIRASEDALIRAQASVPYAVVNLNASGSNEIELRASDGSTRKVTSGQTKIEPGIYTVSLPDGPNGASDLIEFEAVADKRYDLALSQTIFGRRARISEVGSAVEPVELTYRTEDGAHVATDLDAGTYRITVDNGESQTITMGTGAAYFEYVDGSLIEKPILLKNGASSLLATSRKDGTCVVDHLVPGPYQMKEADAPCGFIASAANVSFTVDGLGRIEGDASHVIEVKNDYTKVDISKRDITNEEEIEGAKLAITDEDGNMVDSWTSEKGGHRIDALAPGEYTLTEEMTPNNYDKAQGVDFTVRATGEVQRVVMYDEPIEISGEIDKRQEIADPTAPDTTENGDQQNKAAVTVSESGFYDYSLDYRNTSTTWTDEFTVEDSLDAARGGLAHLVGITTAQVHEDYDGLMNVWYKTDRTPADHNDPSGTNATASDGHENPWLSEDPNGILGDDGRAIDYTGWKLWKADVSTTEATELKVADLGLGKDEHVTAIRFEYGRVEEGFATRLGSWDREDLKSDHDDITDVKATHEGEFFKAGDVEMSYAPAIIHMQVTDAYKEGMQLDNSARVDLWRNGGGARLDDHDKDRVTQALETPSKPLDQTGSDVFAAALAPCIAAFMAVAARVARFHKPRR